jgi:hypothetical protein
MTITFVGSTAGNATNGGNVNLSLSGIAGITNGDCVYVIAGAFGRAGNEARIGNAVGFTQDKDVTSTIRCRTAYKLYQQGTDGTTTVEGSANAADTTVAVAFVFRAVKNSVVDVTTTLASGSSTNPNPPSITPTSNGCVIFAAAVSAVNDTTPGTVTNYTEPTTFTTTNTDTNPATAAAAYLILSGNGGTAQDPAAFSSWSTGAWVSVTAALTPGDTMMQTPRIMM